MNWKKIFNLTEYRDTEISNKAVQLGFSYSKDDTHYLENQLSQFELLKEGRHEIRNILRSGYYPEDPIKIIFDDRQVINYGKSSASYEQTVFFFQSKELSLPDFKLKPEEFYHRFFAWLGYEDIDFESHPEFSNKFHLSGECETVIRNYFNKQVLDYFASRPSLYLEASNYYFILYQHNHLCPVAYLPTFNAICSMIAELFMINSKRQTKIKNKILK